MAQVKRLGDPATHSALADEGRDEEEREAKAARHYFATAQYVADPGSHVHDAAALIKVSNEIFLLMSVVGWLLTLLFNRESIWHNPLTDRLGYTTLCVGLDRPPAL